MVSLRSLVAGVALIAVPVMAALSPAELVERIKDVTQKSQALKAPVQSITVINAPLVVLGQGPIPKLFTASAEILSSAKGVVLDLDETPEGVGEAEATMIVDAFRECVHVNQDVLKLAMSKADLVRAIPVFGGYAATFLDQFAGFANAIADFFIHMAEFWAEQYKAEVNSVNARSTNAAQKFDSISAKKRAEVFVA